MKPTADPSELRHLAQRCRQQADYLDRVVSHLRTTVHAIRADWTGNASESFDGTISKQTQRTRAAASRLRSAADTLERGAGDVQAYREAEERREREDREREKRARSKPADS